MTVMVISGRCGQIPEAGALSKRYSVGTTYVPGRGEWVWGVAELRYWSGLVASLVCVTLAGQGVAITDSTAGDTRSPLGSALSGLHDHWQSHWAGLTLTLPDRPHVSRSFSPLRWITLSDGDQFLAEVTQWEEQRVGLRLSGGQPVSVDSAAIQSIAVPAGEREWLFEPFESIGTEDNDRVRVPTMTRDQLDFSHAAGGQSSLRLSDAPDPLVYSFPQAPVESRLQFWVRVEAHSRFRCRLNFAHGPWQLDVESAQARGISGMRARDGATCQDVTFRPGWHRVTLCLFEDHAFAAWDNLLLISTARSVGPLRGVEFHASTSVWIDNLQVSEFTPRVPGRSSSIAASDDGVTLQDGTQWFGRLRDMNARSMTIAGPGGERSVPWSRVNTVELQPREHPVVAPAIAGLWAEIQWQRPVDHRTGAAKFHAAITRVDNLGIEVRHPFLGDMALAWAEISQIRVEFYGQRTVLHAGSIHLGNSIRADFTRPLPDGIEWSVDFELDAQAAKSTAGIVLQLDAAELEPAHPETPPGSPYLKELRLGGLLTEVLVNQSSVGFLNRELAYRSTVGDPVTLRLRIPSQLLQVGRNTIQLRQHPLSADRQVYDNCEVSNLRLDHVSSDPPHVRTHQLRSSR